MPPRASKVLEAFDNRNVFFATIGVVILITFEPIEKFIHMGHFRHLLKTTSAVLCDPSTSNYTPKILAPPYKFSIGICASDTAPNLSSLLELIESDHIPQDFILSRVILVASGCAGKSIAYARELEQKETRLMIIQEPERYGKADAINKVFEHSDGDFLIFVNADALPSKGSIGKLLESIATNDSVGIASASPFFEPRKGILSKVEQLMWSMHNETSRLLNHMDICNHSNDEMLIVRSNLWRHLPYDLVNDGAFIAACARRDGYSIKFCEDAKVKIDVPSRITDSIEQRRRIIFGHFQIRKLLGQSPITVESMLLSSPLLALKIVVRTLARSPLFIAIFPVTVSSEILALCGALMDFSRSSKRHSVWRRYGN